MNSPYNLDLVTVTTLDPRPSTHKVQMEPESCKGLASLSSAVLLGEGGNMSNSSRGPSVFNRLHNIAAQQEDRRQQKRRNLCATSP